MTFTDIPDGQSVFLDANTLVYYFLADPAYGPACHDLLQRVENQELLGFTSAHVVGEVAHRVMTLEAIDRLGWPVKGIAARLRKHHAEIPQLTVSQQAVTRIPQLGIHVIATTQQLVEEATVVSRNHEVLTNDALVVAVMQANGLTHLASHDADFDRVAGLTRYAPA
jgi:predicted nucleic acid-binding protein